jgi:hypothetical protein
MCKRERYHFIRKHNPKRVRKRNAEEREKRNKQKKKREREGGRVVVNK